MMRQTSVKNGAVGIIIALAGGSRLNNSASKDTNID
jgi:hypothetical protein